MKHNYQFATNFMRLVFKMKYFFISLFLSLILIKDIYCNGTNAGIFMRPYGGIGIYYGHPRELHFYWNWRLREMGGFEIVTLSAEFGSWRKPR